MKIAVDVAEVKKATEEIKDSKTDTIRLSNKSKLGHKLI